jgi:hypothetical protein
MLQWHVCSKFYENMLLGSEIVGGAKVINTHTNGHVDATSVYLPL